MQMPGNYPKARRVEAQMKIEQAERERGGKRERDEPNTGFTCLLMQDDWGVFFGGGGVGRGKRRGKEGTKR